METFQELSTIQAHNNWIRTVAMTPDGKILLSGALDNSVKLWQIESNLVSNN